MLYDSNSWFAGWGFILWFGFIFLLFSSMGNWGYTYRAHRKYLDLSQSRSAFDILDERFAKGELKRDEYLSMREDLVQTGSARTQSKNYAESKASSGMGSPIIAR